MSVRSLVSHDLYMQADVVKTAGELALPVPLVALLFSRGMTNEKEIRSFLYPSSADLHDAFLLPDMLPSAERILSAVKQGEKILIYGDYDADGVTSTAIVKRYLCSIGATVVCYIPDRLGEGYGLNKGVLDGFSSDHIGLMITVDTGTTAPDEIHYAATLGIETVVTDHHECTGSLPQCVGVINPMRSDSRYPFKSLAGVGVAFKLICAIECLRTPEKSFRDISEELLCRYGDLVALGTVADVMPMLDENRHIVKMGIELMKNRGNPGLSALIKEISGKKGELSSSAVGYRLAPHINAAGRMGRAERALELLLADEKGEALLLSKELCNYNLQRKAEEEKILKEAYALLSEKETASEPLIILAGEGWHRGVLGIVAARLTEKLKTSVILISLEGEYGYGSGRGVDGMNLVALLEECAADLEKFGGHEQAAGLTLKRERLDAFASELSRLASKQYEGRLSGREEQMVDMVLSSLDLSLPFAEALSLLEPFGTGNRTPLFLLEGAIVEQVTALSGGAHTKLLVEKDELYYTALQFNLKTALLPYVLHDRVDLIFELSVNDYLGRKSVQLMVKDILPSGLTLTEFQIENKKIDLLNDGVMPLLSVPDRGAFARVYRALRAIENGGEGIFSLRRLTKENEIASLSVCYLILMILREQGLLVFDKVLSEEPRTGCDLLSFELIKTDKKVDIERSALYNAAKGHSEL